MIWHELKERGYTTSHIGKWHLGIHEGSRPTDQGFDHSYAAVGGPQVDADNF